jgi:hypothetical protein
MTDMREGVTPLLIAAVPVFVAGCAAWMFPGATRDMFGPWLLPALSVIGLMLGLALAAEWLLLRGLLLVLAIMLVLSWNRASGASTSHFAGAAFGCLLMTGIGRWANTPRRITLGMAMVLGVGLLMVLVGLAGAALRPGSLLDTASTSRLPSIQLGLAGMASDGDVNANALAAVVLLVMPLAVSVLVLGVRERSDRWMLLPAAVVVVVVGSVTLVLSHSRTALMAVWFIAVGLLVGGLRPWFYRLAAGVVVVTPLLLVTGRMPFLTQEVALRDANNGWVSARGRAEIVSQALDRLKQSPWRGIGLNEFRNVYAPRPGDLPQGQDVVHVHNIVLQTALDVGIVGSIAYWGILIVLWVRARQAARAASNAIRIAAVGSAFALVAVSLFGLTDAVTLGSKVGTLQWAAGGLILAAWQIHSRTLGPSVSTPS